MPFDTKTLWMALVVSNLTVGALMLAYATSESGRRTLRMWALGQVLKGIGIAAIVWRSELPLALAYLGNSLVIIGYAFELLAFLRYSQLTRFCRPALALLVGLLVVMNGAGIMTMYGWQAKDTAVVFSSSLALLTLCSAATLYRSDRSRSIMQWVLITSTGLLAAALFVRAMVAATSDAWVPHQNMAVNQILFALGFIFSITDGFGFLLLVKEDADRTLLRMATEDELTGLMNRSSFMRRSTDCLRLCQRTGQPVSVMMVDVDHFKMINDTHGHAAGDKLLAAMGAILRSNLREVDIYGRIGGEEFAVMLPGTNLEAAVQTAERLRQAIASTMVDHQDTKISMTASLGICQPAHTESLDMALSIADAALYTAKSEGRNRVVAALERARRGYPSLVKCAG